MQEPSQFLSAINIYGVTEQMGEKIGMGIGGPNAGTTDTTDTTLKDRETTDITTLDRMRKGMKVTPTK